MPPNRSIVRLDPGTFARMKRILPGRARTQAATGTDQDVLPVPDEIAFKLTNRCNLRCTHCYQWSAHGHHQDLAAAEQQRDLDFAHIEQVFRATAARKSSVYLWGGEPLAYGEFDALADLLRRDPRWTVICTNGMLIEHRLAALLSISAQLEMYVALDGFAAEHDAIRGRGAYDKVARGLDSLVAKRASGEYRGEVSINSVVTDHTVATLYDFIAAWQDRGIDTFYISLPWFLSADSARAMDDYRAENMTWLGNASTGDRPSWHAYQYGLGPACVAPLLEQLDRIDAAAWRIKVRYNPEPDRTMLAEFLAGGARPMHGKTRCTALNSRLDVFPNGDVVTCKFFPEFAVGNLGAQPLDEIWHGDRFQRVRDTVRRCGLMPVCAKCNLLYSRGV